jgi:nucleoside-diphosphate-sugar epimerase
MGRHVLLGGSGTIGRAALPHLVAAGHDVSIVQRHPAAVTGRETLVAADALDVEALARAAEGADVLYCVVGLPYDSRIWRRDFPCVVGNAVEAARRTGARLVYFDNVYSYGPVEGWMTEDCPIRPTTEKGLARAECARIVMEAVERQGLRACIARSADFYGAYPQFDMIGDWGVQLKRGKPALALYRDLHPRQRPGSRIPGRNARGRRRDLAHAHRSGAAHRPADAAADRRNTGGAGAPHHPAKATRPSHRPLQSAA